MGKGYLESRQGTQNVTEIIYQHSLIIRLLQRRSCRLMEIQEHVIVRMEDKGFRPSISARSWIRIKNNILSIYGILIETKKVGKYYIYYIDIDDFKSIPDHGVYFWDMIP